jgi:hypothetical protein
MTKATNTNTVHAVINAAFAYAEGIEQLRKAFKGKERDVISKAIMGDVASHPKYQVPLIKGEGKAEGAMVLDKTHAKYEACRKALQRIVGDIMGRSDGTKEPAEEIEVPAEILAAAAKLAKLCAEYEGARKLASTAIAQAFAK